MKMIKDKLPYLLKDNLVDGFKIYENSFRTVNGKYYFLIKIRDMKYIGILEAIPEIEILNPGNYFSLTSCYKEIKVTNGYILRLYDTGNENINRLKNIFPDLKPTTSMKDCSFGFGDRLGLATPGHIRAIKDFNNIFPFFAQQSVREMEKTQRDFESVLNSAVLAIFQEGYSGQWGADADHIKDEKDILAAIDAGFTMFTIDTTDMLGGKKHDMQNKSDFSNAVCDGNNLEKIANDYLGREIILKGHNNQKHILKYDQKLITEILEIYGKSIDFIVKTYNLIKNRVPVFDFEISFDETNIVTTPQSHYMVADLMRKIGIHFSSIALKFPGIFEKGIEYRGDIKLLIDSLATHNSISESIGGYKLSLHSGSDKLSVYPYFTEYTKGRFHIKTSGTSWVEALHTISIEDIKLFKKIYTLSASEYSENNKAYHLSLKTGDVPLNLNDFDLKNADSIIYNDTVRQVLHIAYGVILKEYGKKIFGVLNEHEEKHYNFIKNHIKKHLKALA